MRTLHRVARTKNGPIRATSTTPPRYIVTTRTLGLQLFLNPQGLATDSRAEALEFQAFTDAHERARKERRSGTWLGLANEELYWHAVTRHE